jgi:hypothetical protein
MRRAFARLPLLVQVAALLGLLVVMLGWSALEVQAWLDRAQEMPSAGAAPARSAIGVPLAAALLGSALALASLACWATRQVLCAMALARYAQRLIGAAPGAVTVQPVHLDGEEVTSRNELHRLSAAVKAVGRALRLAQSGPA